MTFEPVEAGEWRGTPEQVEEFPALEMPLNRAPTSAWTEYFLGFDFAARTGLDPRLNPRLLSGRNRILFPDIERDKAIDAIRLAVDLTNSSLRVSDQTLG